MNKTRPIQKKFRVSDSECMVLEKKLQSSGLSLQEYLLKAALDRPVKTFPEGFDVQLKEIYRNLRNATGNLNQVSRHLNYGDLVSSEELHHSLLQVDAVTKEIEAFLTALKETD